MKFISPIILSMLMVLTMQLEGVAQCSQCTPNASCFQPGGAQCPPSGQSPPMYLNNAYSTVVTFDMPPDTNVSPIGEVQIVNVQYQSISGLPIGISWSCNNTSNGCQYNPSAGETKACITFCGTPLSPPGTYTATINIYGTASTPFGNQTQFQPLTYDFVVLGDTASNGYFTMSQAFGCDSIAVDYDATFNPPLPSTVSYDWTLGNGNTFAGATPPTQTYNTPGTYVPTLTTHVNKLVVKKVTATVSGNWWCGDVEEPNWPIVGCTAQPDVYFLLTHGTSVYTSSATSDNASGSWDNLGITLLSPLFTINLWDDDGTSQDDNGGLAALNINGPGTFSYTTSGGFGSVEVIEVLDYNIVTTDTVNVYPFPNVEDIAISPADTVCEKEWITLTAPTGTYAYEWYKNGTLLTDTSGSSISLLNQNGTYTVKLTNTLTGCSAWMNPATVYFKPGVYNMFISYNSGVLMNDPPTGFEYQWLFNGSPVFPGGTAGIYTPTATGNYACVVTNEYGCSDTTSSLLVSSLAGISDFSDMSDQVSLFPNPAKDRMTITFASEVDCAANIRIMNNVGTVIRTQKVNCAGGGNSFDISVDDLAAGMYYIELTTDKGFAAKRFIKQ